MNPDNNDDLATIHYRGKFDLDGLYKMQYKWFKDHNFDFYESLHKSKKPELELTWDAERKISGYIKQYVSLQYHFWGLHDIEVVEDGVKKKMNEGRFTLHFFLNVKTDYEESWEEEKSKLRKRLKHFYENYIIKKEILVNQVQALTDEVRELQDKTKEFLGMEGV